MRDCVLCGRGGSSAKKGGQGIDGREDKATLHLRSTTQVYAPLAHQITRGSRARTMVHSLADRTEIHFRVEIPSSIKVLGQEVQTMSRQRLKKEDGL